MCCFPVKSNKMWNFCLILWFFLGTAYCTDSKAVALDLAYLKPYICTTQAISILFSSQNQQNVKFWLIFPGTPPDKKLKKSHQFCHKEKVFFCQRLFYCKSAHIGFWVCQLQCTMLQLCVTSTLWIIMVFLHFFWEGQDIGFWNIV